ncbi:CDP-glucose 4,6-dehydratase [Bosea sp. (in: a-proteobacteria)]|jgi:CDP-glucose 4,6-dehydratase|uniref:CDP-glucose 4,6-dehydratase n=1 Tax=Bosea sp. (in: a-proteobacteria) TaxID=1871050 RepID=UPI002DDD7E08|nr:CDP-glucose 4,6-dehydratase [Bosea sp. (in: a-proteobacteria)]HEV2508993.1 CDP-glucose 4,6-dehydratase [Bosea sp. (in: a-proteobacteria)]
MDASFWKGKRVLLTGHTGFKGGWSALMLRSMGAEVTGLALAPDQTPSFFERAKVGEVARSIIGDIRDLDTVKRAVAESRAEIVLHLAAQALVRRGYNEPVETFATNVMGTAHVLEAARLSGHVRSVLVVTSDKCYENREWVWPYRENEAMGGYDPYSSSKGCAELLTSAYRRSFFSEQGIGLATARAGNVIGGGDWSDARLVPDLVRGLEQGRSVFIRQPESIRPWQHVMDALAGYFLLVEKLWHEPAQFGDGWNFGPSDESVIPVRLIANELVRLWGGPASWQHDPESGAHEARILKLDSAKARSFLGWKPRLTVPEALAKIVEWHKSDGAGADMQAVTLSQIHAYSSAGKAK